MPTPEDNKPNGLLNRFKLFGRDNSIKEIASKKSLQSTKDSIDSLNKDAMLRLYGSDNEFENDTLADFDKIKSVLSFVDNSFNKSTAGTNVVDLLVKADYMNKKSNSAHNKSFFDPNRRINLFSEIDLGIVNDIFSSEKERITTYSDYEQIYDYIPQLAQATEAIVDNILSPDDFSKNFFSVTYEKNIQTLVDGKDTELKNINDELNKLTEIYELEERAKTIIRKSLILGDYFLAVVNLNSGFNKILNENKNAKRVIYSRTINTNDIQFNQEDLAALAEYCKESLIKERKITINTNSTVSNNRVITRFNQVQENILNEVTQIINENFEIKTSSDILNEQKLLFEDYDTVRALQDIDVGDDSYQNRPTNMNTITGTGNKYKRNVDTISGKDRKNNYVAGSYIYPLDPRRVVKIYNHGVCYGYYYLEPIDILSEPLISKNLNNLYTYNILQATDVSTGSTYFSNPKTRLIIDTFARALASKLNKKFVADNPQFKTILYNLARHNDLFNKRIRVTYFAPNEIVHFYNELDEETGYGKSIYRKVLFSAKLYISVLTCNLMMKLSRSQDRRTFYVETGLDRAGEESAHQLIRDIKARDIRMSCLDTIDSIFNVVGRFNDYVIPTTNGDPAVRIESTPGQNADIEDDLVEYLRKTIISGIGVPSSYIAYADELDYARSVSMMNGQFLRSTVVRQGRYGKQFSELYRLLYLNEYILPNHINKGNKPQIILDNIKAKFPAPATLNVTNLSESLNNVKGLVDALTEIVVGDEGGENGIRFFFTKQLVKEYLPTVDWNELDQILNNSSIEKVLNDQKKKLAGGEEGSMDTGGGEESYGGEEEAGVGGEEEGAMEEPAPEDQTPTEPGNEPSPQGNEANPEENREGVPEPPQMG